MADANDTVTYGEGQMKLLVLRVNGLALGTEKAESLISLGRPTYDQRLASKDSAPDGRPSRIFGSSAVYVGSERTMLARMPPEEDPIKTGEATIELFFDNADRLASVASNIQGVANRRVAVEAGP
jgi:hypothetical protein